QPINDGNLWRAAERLLQTSRITVQPPNVAGTPGQHSDLTARARQFKDQLCDPEDGNFFSTADIEGLPQRGITLRQSKQIVGGFRNVCEITRLLTIAVNEQRRPSECPNDKSWNHLAFVASVVLARPVIVMRARNDCRKPLCTVEYL